jgi:tRNA modification GTPase
VAASLDAHDTIAAVATPPGPSQRGIVRLSGPDAWRIAEAGFEPEEAGSASSGAPRAFRPARAEVRFGSLRLEGLRPPLPARIALWPAPRTYTGQPIAEIHIVGSIPLLNLLLANCLARGARHAEPGEFTLRAFLSGRLDLTRAEAVLGVIEARNPAQLEAALRQLAGGLSGPIRALRDRLLDVVAHLEANLDFAEEPDVDLLGRTALADELEGAATTLETLARRLTARDRPGGAPKVVLVGPPNAGKSRLFNALIGGERALVSSVAGTTRDYLAAFCDCDGLVVELVDTAGLDEARSDIERQAQAFRAEQAEQADLRLECRPADTLLIPRDPNLQVCPAGNEADASVAGELDRLIIWTKCDLRNPVIRPDEQGSDAVVTSAATGDGLERLRLEIARVLRRQDAEGELPATTGVRCRDSLVGAGRSLRAASCAVARGHGDELVAIDLRQAIDELGKVVGEVVADDILDRIFRRFCIGK